jgi:hypothetical protein
LATHRLELVALREPARVAVLIALQSVEFGNIVGAKRAITTAAAIMGWL